MDTYIWIILWYSCFQCQYSMPPDHRWLVQSVFLALFPLFIYSTRLEFFPWYCSFNKLFLNCLVVVLLVPGLPVQFSCSAMSNSLWVHGLQHARLPCPSLTPGAYSNSCPLCWWCHPTISPSIVPFSSCLQSFPASGSFPMSQFFTSGGQSIGVSASASVLPKNIEGRFPLGLTGWTFLQSKGLSRLFSNGRVQKHQFFGAQHSLEFKSHIRTWLLEKP